MLLMLIKHKKISIENRFSEKNQITNSLNTIREKCGQHCMEYCIIKTFTICALNAQKSITKVDYL